MLFRSCLVTRRNQGTAGPPLNYLDDPPSIGLNIHEFLGDIGDYPTWWERDQKKTNKDQKKTNRDQKKTKSRKHEKTQGNYHEIKAKPMDQKKTKSGKERKKERNRGRKKERKKEKKERKKGTKEGRKKERKK